MKKTGFIRRLVFARWFFLGKRTGYRIKRSYISKTVTIDFLAGGQCVKYDYNGKYIAG